MKKGDKDKEMRAEYNRESLKTGVRGKYYEEYNKSHNIVLLDPEVLKAFPTEEAVNEALLSLIKLANKSVSLSKRSS